MDLFSDIPKKPTAALSVTQLIRKMKRAIESNLGKLWIEGEVSNLTKQGSGHWYFSLKDNGAQIQCAMFNARRREGSESLANGAKVRVFAEPSIYETRGQLQIIVEKAELSGAGDLQARFEALKRKLNDEGLFDPSLKKIIPSHPRIIGIVTSPTGAALQDILNILSRRAPWIQPVLFPVRVQGSGAENEIANAIQKLNQPEKFGYPRCDVLIVGRGGGSIEDLWAFNEEIAARAIAASSIPIISAVGHEIDFTIADFVADLRAPTPSAAAEIATPNIAEILAQLAETRKRLARPIVSHIQNLTTIFHSLARRLQRQDPERLLREPSQTLDNLREILHRHLVNALRSRQQNLLELRRRHLALRPSGLIETRLDTLANLQRYLHQHLARNLDHKQQNLARIRSMIRALGPESALKRGFTITLDQDGNLIRSARTSSPGQTIRTRFIDGEITSTTN